MKLRHAVLALPVLLALGAVPALADTNGSTEQKTVTRSCGAPADPHYSPPKATDCKTKGKFDKKKSYQATHYSNDVSCGSKNSVAGPTPVGLQVYASGDAATQSGAIGICSDGQLPLQGRVGAAGGTGGGTVTVDGDKDNVDPAPAQAGGFLIASVGTSPGVVCGKDYESGGKGDSDSPSDASQDSCG